MQQPTNMKEYIMVVNANLELARAALAQHKKLVTGQQSYQEVKEIEATIRDISRRVNTIGAA